MVETIETMCRSVRGMLLSDMAAAQNVGNPVRSVQQQNAGSGTSSYLDEKEEAELEKAIESQRRQFQAEEEARVQEQWRIQRDVIKPEVSF